MEIDPSPVAGPSTLPPAAGSSSKPSTQPVEAYYKIEFDDFSYYLQTINVTIGRRVQPQTFENPSESLPIPPSTSTTGSAPPPSASSTVAPQASKLNSFAQTIPPTATDPSPPLDQASSAATGNAAASSLTSTPHSSSKSKIKKASPHQPVASTSKLPSSSKASSPAARGDPNQGIDVDLGALKAVSRLHARISYDDQQASYVLDVLGRNGAWVDDEYVGRGKRALLRERTKIQISIRTFHFVLPPNLPSLVEDSEGVFPDQLASSSHHHHHSRRRNSAGQASSSSLSGSGSDSAMESPRTRKRRNARALRSDGSNGSESSTSRTGSENGEKSESNENRTAHHRLEEPRAGAGKGRGRGKGAILPPSAGKGLRRSTSAQVQPLKLGLGGGSGRGKGKGKGHTNRESPPVIKVKLPTRLEQSSSSKYPRPGLGKGYAALASRHHHHHELDSSDEDDSEEERDASETEGEDSPRKRTITLSPAKPSKKTTTASKGKALAAPPKPRVGGKMPKSSAALAALSGAAGRDVKMEDQLSTSQLLPSAMQVDSVDYSLHHQQSHSPALSPLPGHAAPNPFSRNNPPSFSQDRPFDAQQSFVPDGPGTPTPFSILHAAGLTAPGSRPAPVASTSSSSSVARPPPPPLSASALVPLQQPSIPAPSQSQLHQYPPPIPPAADHTKPPLTYTSVILLSLQGMEGRTGTLQEIIDWIIREFEWFRVNRDSGWQTTLRHSLSNNKAFIKLPLAPHLPKTTPPEWTLDADMEAALAEKATKEIKSRLQKQEKAKKAREKEIMRQQSIQLAAERAEQTRLAQQQNNPSALALPSRPSPRPPAARPGAGRPPAVRPTPTVRPPNSNNNASSRPPPPSAITVATTASIPIIVAPIPAAALKNTPVNTSTSNLLDSPPIVLHEGTLILNPSIFSHLSTEQLDHLRSLGAQQAIQILQAYIVQHLKEKMASGAGGRPGSAATSAPAGPSKSSAAGGVRPPPARPANGARPPPTGACPPPSSASGRLPPTGPRSPPSTTAGRPPGSVARPPYARPSPTRLPPTGPAGSRPNPALEALLLANPSAPSPHPPADPIAALTALSARPEGTPDAPGLSSLGPHAPALLQYLNAVGANANMDAAASLVKTGRAPGVPLYVAPAGGTAAAAAAGPSSTTSVRPPNPGAGGLARPPRPAGTSKQPLPLKPRAAAAAAKALPVRPAAGGKTTRKAPAKRAAPSTSGKAPRGGANLPPPPPVPIPAPAPVMVPEPPKPEPTGFEFDGGLELEGMGFDDLAMELGLAASGERGVKRKMEEEDEWGVEELMGGSGSGLRGALEEGVAEEVVETTRKVVGGRGKGKKTRV